jgi:hypothetical protein
MQQVQINRLTATVPAAIDAGQRARLRAYVDTVRRCERRIQLLRSELEQALQSAAAAPGDEGDPPPEPNAVLQIAAELDGLERLQPRVDGWLKEYVAALVNQQTAEGYSDAETYGDGAPM